MGLEFTVSPRMVTLRLRSPGAAGAASWEWSGAQCVGVVWVVVGNDAA